METQREREIFQIVLENEPIGISDILEKISSKVSIPTLNRDLSKLKKGNFILPEGNGPGTKYKINLKGLLHARIDVEAFFKIDVDNRKILNRYNPDIFENLKKSKLFTEKEMALLEKQTAIFQKKLKNTSSEIYKREFERLMIELSWKSSQIEGNTYDLLDTEQLLKYNIPSPGHTVEETTMLLNHKKAIEYTRANSDLYTSLSISKIIDIHTLLTNQLDISKTIRKRLVRITGTNYTPPDNQFIIEEALQKLCVTVDAMDNVYEKALATLLLISYIQPFDDGNKRTARLTANALLMAADRCPLSYRSISSGDFKKSILLFYEMNNITAFKKIFISQYEFAVENYF